MATINIKRTSEFINGLRSFRIFIDGQLVGKIADGETKDFETTAGRHTLVAKIDWCSSPGISIEVGENETRNLQVGGFKNGNWIMPIASGIVTLHFILTMTTDINYLVFLVIPAFILLLYYITFGRKKYLTLTELNCRDAKQKPGGQLTLYWK